MNVSSVEAFASNFITIPNISPLAVTAVHYHILKYAIVLYAEAGKKLWYPNCYFSEQFLRNA